MRGFRSCRSHASGRFTPSATMTVLKAGDVGRILVRPTDHAKEAIGPRAAANNHTFLIASNHPKFPVLSDRYTSYDRLKFLQGCKPLAHVEPRVHFRHVGDGTHAARVKMTEQPRGQSQISRQLIPSGCSPQSARVPSHKDSGRAGQLRRCRFNRAFSSEDCSELSNSVTAEI